MNRIERLLAELAPDGVRAAELGSLVRIRNGMDHKALGDGDIPVYGSGGLMRRVDSSLASGPSVLIPRKGSLGNIFYVEEPFWHVDTIFRTEIDEGQIMPRFLYHQLLKMHLGDMNQAGGVPSQTQSVLNRLRIPVPPLEVQREIVAILDKFTQLETELEAELKAELELRRRQFSFYRDQLLSFERERERVRWARLSDVGTFTRGRRFTKEDYRPIGIPAIHYGDIYTTLGTSTTCVNTHVRADLEPSLRFAEPGDLVLAGVGETVEDVGRSVAWLGDEPVAVHDDCFVFSSDLDPTFLAYVTQTAAYNRSKVRHVFRAKVKRLSATGLGQIPVPVPPLGTQQRIVAQLNHFDAHVNDISIGLPAELAARRKQYEYYRDKLLTFRELH